MYAVKLFQDNNKQDENDPYLISPKGIKVQVPQRMVSNLLDKGFRLVDRNWQPKVAEDEQVTISRDVPLNLKELKEKIGQQMDLLEVTEI